MMRAAAALLLLALGSVAHAQAPQPNFNNIVPTAPFGTSNNQAASTAFVNSSVNGNTVNAVAADYTLKASDCGKRIQAGSGSTGFFAVTLPSPLTIACQISIINGDSARGKKLTGFPSDAPPILWPKQEIAVSVVNGAWAVVKAPGRWRLPTATNLYFDPVNGSNSNDCLASGAGNACATAQYVWDTAANSLDLAGKTITLQGASGSYANAGLLTSQPMLGSSGPFGVIVDFGGGTISMTNGASCFEIGSGVGTAPLLGLLIQNFTCTSTVSGIDNFGAVVLVGSGVVFGATTGSHVKAAHPGTQVFFLNNYSISGGAQIHWDSETGGMIVAHGLTVDCQSGPRAFSVAFSYSLGASIQYVGGMTFANCGSATGTRYIVNENSVVNVAAGGANYLPGNSAGAAVTGGQYN